MKTLWVQSWKIRVQKRKLLKVGIRDFIRESHLKFENGNLITQFKSRGFLNLEMWIHQVLVLITQIFPSRYIVPFSRSAMGIFSCELLTFHLWIIITYFSCHLYLPLLIIIKCQIFCWNQSEWEPYMYCLTF